MAKKQRDKQYNKTRWLLAAGTVAAFSAALCCIIPLILFLLGISGTWVSTLTMFEPLSNYFLAAAIILVAIGFWRVYNQPKAGYCKPGTFCSIPESDLINKIMMWSATSIIVLVLLYKYFAPAILEKF